MVRDERVAEPDPMTVARAARDACGRAVSDVAPISKGINAIYRIAFADGDTAVLKAATFNTAAELRPEPRLLSVLGRETDVPVPEVLAIVEDGGPLDVFHFLLDHCEGRQLRHLDALSESDQERLVREVGRQLARLHELPVVDVLELDDGAGPADVCGPLRVDTGGETGFEFTTGGRHDSWGEVFASLADHPVSLFERVQSGDDEGRFADLVPGVVAAFDDVADRIAEPERPTLLHRDFHLDNFVLDSAGGGRLIRTVLDFGDPYVGDYRLDLAFAEDAMIRVQLPASDRATALCELLRATYARERGIDRDEIANRNYAYYLLTQRSRWMAVAMNWEEYDDPAAVERAYRSFVGERLAEVQ